MCASEAQQPQLVLDYRYMLRRDLPEVLRIESDIYEWWSWSEADFMRQLGGSKCIGRVAVWKEQVIAYLIYERTRKAIQIENVTVHRSFQRHGIGRAMIGNLVGSARQPTVVEVRETNLGAQLFFRACGFRATDVLQDFYEDTSDDAYRMQFDRMAKLAVSVPADER